MLQDIVKYSLVTSVKYWFISHFDKRFTVVVYVRLSYRGIKEYWSSIWYVIALKIESRYDANIVITQVVIMMTTCRDHSDDKVGITTIFYFRYYSWSSEHQDYEYIATDSDFLHIMAYLRGCNIL